LFPDQFNKTLLFILILISFEIRTWSQELDYQKIFDKNWDNAVKFEQENREWISKIFDKNNISYPLGIGIIFPELVRYSALRDKIEITLLKTLYINLGDEYANFSIGQFQMKPSFAESIREQFAQPLKNSQSNYFKKRSAYKNITEYRRSVVTGLEDIKIQVLYLVAFIKICEKSFNINTMDYPAKLKFLATAYNYGFEKSFSQIIEMEDKKFFNTRLIKTENYSYCLISEYWYRKYIAQNHKQ
jgi:hypothetical protein